MGKVALKEVCHWVTQLSVGVQLQGLYARHGIGERVLDTRGRAGDAGKHPSLPQISGVSGGVHVIWDDFGTWLFFQS